MFAGKKLRCDCGYEVRTNGEAAQVDEVRRHASEAHGVDLSVDLALDLVRGVGVVSHGEQASATEERQQ